MAKRTPEYGERVVKARSMLAYVDDTYREKYGTPVYGDSTRFNQLRGLISSQTVEVDSMLFLMLEGVEPARLVNKKNEKKKLTSGMLVQEVRAMLNEPKGSVSVTGQRLDVIDKAVDKRNEAAHGDLSVYVFIDGPIAPPDAPASYERQQQREIAYMNTSAPDALRGAPGLDEDMLLADLELQQKALEAAVRIWIDLKLPYPW
ncbi:hypothetical protein [Streptomyces hydrogenans]